MSSQHPKWRYVTDDPDLMRMWDGERNTLNPSEVRRSSKALAWWRCPNCGQSWQSTIAARCNSKNKERCPQCSFVLRDALKRELTGSLSDYPDLVAEWIADKNMPLVPDKVAPGSARKVWWRCPKGHEYRSKVHHRVASGVGCAQCSEPKRLAKSVDGGDQPCLGSPFCCGAVVLLWAVLWGNKCEVTQGLVWPRF